MTKAKRIKKLEESGVLGYKEEVDKLKQELKIEERRIEHYLILLTADKCKREQSYINRKQIKIGERESCRQHKIRLNKERRAKLSA